MGAVSSVIETVVDAVSDVADFVVDEIIEPVVDTVETVVENPVALASVALSIAAPGVGTAIGSALGASGAAATALGNAVIGGTLAEASGGDFAKGALTAGAGSLIGGAIAPEITAATGSGAASGAITSGLLSEIQGGDFIQGAVQGGISGAINDAKLAAAEDYLQSLPGGYEIDAAPAPTEADVLAAITADQAPIYDASYVPDTSFTPDYSLSTGASGEPSLTVAPITTEYKVGSYDYTLGDLIDSLGLTAPTTPNIDSMGGGQGIILKTNDGYITESGFVPNTYVSSLGDTSSFINKPVIDTGLSYDELKNTSESDLNAKLAGLDVAKALTPVALSALMKSAYDTANSEASDGFAIIPVPSDWQSPEYNMAFAPSAPINFGTADLLKGTQWEKPMDLGSLINTINSQSSVFNAAPDILQQFNQPYTAGVNDQIGNLNGSPVSISDIIASIQSQYGQTPTSTMG